MTTPEAAATTTTITTTLAPRTEKVLTKKVTVAEQEQ